MKLSHGLILTLVSFLFVVAITAYQPFFLEFEHKAYDVRYGFKVSKKSFEDIIIVDIDIRSLEKLGRFQNWPRRYFAEVVRYLGSVRVLGIDILWAESDSLGQRMQDVVGPRLDSLTLPKEEIFSFFSFDQELAQAMEENGKAILVASLEEGRLLEPVPILRKAALGVGLGKVVADLDGVVRRTTPYYRIADNTAPFPCFAYLIAARAAGMNETPDLKPRNIGFYGEEGSFRRLSFFDVLEKRIAPGFFKDKIVLIGATALGLYDVHPVPFAPVFPGVEINANLVYDYLNNYFVKSSPYYLTLLLILIFALLTVMLFYYLRPLKGAVVILFVYLVFLLGNQILFNYNLWLEIVRPTYGIIAAVIITLGYRFLFEERQKRAIREMFSRYVSEEVINELADNPPVLGGKKIDATVLFSDIRDFTTLSEKLSPEAIVKILNDYFTIIADEIFKNQGMVDKYIGDGIMAVFGAPVAYPDHALRAVKTALAMRDRVDEIREKYPIRIGIGINSGPMVCGNIGSHKRMDYTVIGDNVNLAARLEALTKDFNVQITMSDATFRAVESFVDARDLGMVKVKGKEREIHVYEVLGHKAAK